MILAALLAALAPQGASHAALHPAGATLFLEVPDVSGLCEAYEAAPVLQMLRDEAVRETLGALGVPGEALEIGPAIKRGLAEWSPGGVGAALISDIAAISISVTLDEASEKPLIHAVIDYANEQTAQLASELSAGLAENAELPDLRLSVEGKRVTVTTLAAGAAGGLDEDASYKRCNALPRPGSGVTVLGGFFRLSLYEAMELASAVSGEPMGSELAMLEGVGGMSSFRMQLRGDRFVTEFFLPDDGAPERPIFGGQPLKREWLAPVPGGTMIGYSSALDGVACAAYFEAMLGEGIGDKFASVLKRVGPGFVSYAEPLASIGVPRTFFWIELQDPDGFQAEVTSLIEQAGALMPGFGAKTRDYRVKDANGERVKVPVTSITLPAEMMQHIPIPMSPAFAVYDGKLLMSLSSMHVKRELKRLYAGAPNAGTNPVAANDFKLPVDARSVIWMDWGALVNGVVSLVRSAGPMIAGMMGGDLPFDLNNIPPPETFTRFFRPTFHYSQRVDGGEYRYHEASFGPETWVGIGGSIAAAQNDLGFGG